MEMNSLLVNGGAKVDYLLAGALVSAAPLTIWLEKANIYLVSVGLIIGVALALLRLRRQWKYRNTPPDGAD